MYQNAAQLHQFMIVDLFATVIILVTTIVALAGNLAATVETTIKKFQRLKKVLH